MMKTGRWKTWLGLLVGLLLAGNVARSLAAAPQTGPSEKDKVKGARVLGVAGQLDEHSDVLVGNYVAGNGIIEPADRETKVSSQVAGRIAAILVREGSIVELGQPLARLDSDTESAALQAAEADLRGARAELTRTLRGLRKEDVDAVVAEADTAQAHADESQDMLERIRTLAKTGASTPDELVRAEKQAEADRRSLDGAQAKRTAALAGGRAEDISVAQAKVAGAQARRDEAKAALDRLTIRAPIAGEVLQVKPRAGEYYSPTGQEPLVIMGDTSKLRVRMDVDERDVAKIKLDANAFATLSAFPGRRVAGKVAEIGRRMGRKNVRTDDPTERIDTKILEVVIDLSDTTGLVPGLRVVSYIELP